MMMGGGGERGVSSLNLLPFSGINRAGSVCKSRICCYFPVGTSARSFFLL